MTKTNEVLIKKKKSKLKVVEGCSASIVTNKKKLKIVTGSNNSDSDRDSNKDFKTNKKPKIRIVEEPSKNDDQTFTIKPKKKGKKKKLNITDNKLEKKPEMNDFQTFVRDCKKADYEYIKFHGKTKWVGPAIMLDNDSNITESDIRKSTNVKLDKETFDMCIVLYPSNYCDPLSVGYPQQDDVDDTIINQTTISNIRKVNPIQEMLDSDEDEFEVVPWFHDGKQYNVNPVDNYLYDIDSDECIGKRVIDNDSRKYNIDFTDLDG